MLVCLISPCLHLSPSYRREDADYGKSYIASIMLTIKASSKEFQRQISKCDCVILAAPTFTVGVTAFTVFLTVFIRSLQHFCNQVLGSFFVPAYVQLYRLYIRQVRGFCGYKDKPHSVRPETEHSSYGCLWMTFPCTTVPHTIVLCSRQTWAVRK